MEFVLGNFGGGKTYRVIQKAVELMEENKSVLIIVPSRRHKDQLLTDILKIRKGIAGNPVQTLGEFQNNLIEELFPIPSDRPVSLSNFEKFLIISSICGDLPLKAFKGISQRPELMKMVYRLVQSIRDKDIDHLQSISQLQDKIEDLQMILDKYQEILKSKNISDPKSTADIISKHLQGLDSGFLADNIFVDGFVDFTATQYKLVKSIADYALSKQKNVSVSLITEETISQFESDYPDAQKITVQHPRASADLADAFLGNTAFDGGDLEFFEIQAYGKNKEIQYIINQIKKLCIEEKYSLEDIILISPSQALYTTFSELRKASIPFASGKDEKLSQNPLILFIKKCIDLMVSSLNHESLEILAQSNYVKDSYRQLWSKVPVIVPFAVDGGYAALLLGLQ